MIHLKLKDSEGWLSTQKSELHSPEFYQTVGDIMDKMSADSTEVRNFSKKLKSYAEKHGLNSSPFSFSLETPSTRSTARISNAFATNDISSDLAEMSELLKDWPQLHQSTTTFLDKITKKYEVESRYQYRKDQLKNNPFTDKEIDALCNIHAYWILNTQQYKKLYNSIGKVENLIKTGAVVVAEQKVENSYIEKTAWALFADCDGESGYVDKHGKLGEISAARLFDTQKDAHSTGKRKTLDGFEVMELKISLQKRTNLNPTYQNSKMLEALSYMERDKLNSFLDELGTDKVEEIIKERKKNKL